MQEQQKEKKSDFEKGEGRWGIVCGSKPSVVLGFQVFSFLGSNGEFSSEQLDAEVFRCIHSTNLAIGISNFSQPQVRIHCLERK
jgi:hypothetical protein